MARCWLVKSEPDTYGWHDLEADGRTPWDGIRNYQARNFMRDEMRTGERVLFYHSQVQPPGVVGLAEVVSEPYPDPTQFDPSSRYFDPKATQEEPRWFLVDLAPVRALERMVTLAEIKREPSLHDMPLVQRGQRLSVMPAGEDHVRRILEMAASPAEHPS